jgi:hypothetical protein
MIDVFCFNCGFMFTINNMTKNPTKHCPACKNKLEDELLNVMFENQ